MMSDNTGWIMLIVYEAGILYWLFLLKTLQCELWEKVILYEQMGIVIMDYAKLMFDTILKYYEQKENLKIGSMTLTNN